MIYCKSTKHISSKNETLEHFKYFHAKFLKQFNKKILVRLDKRWNIVLGYLLIFARSKVEGYNLFKHTPHQNNVAK